MTGSRRRSCPLPHLFAHETGLGVVDLAREPDQLGLIRVGRDDEPRINGNAMAAHPRPRRQNRANET